MLVDFLMVLQFSQKMIFRFSKSLAPLFLRQSFPFSLGKTRTKAEADQNIIQGFKKVSNITEFLLYFKNNKDKFRINQLAQTSEKMLQLLKQPKPFDRPTADELMKNIESQNLKQLHYLELIGLLNIVSRFEELGGSYNHSKPAKKSILAALQNIITNTPTQTLNDLSQFIRYYSDLAEGNYGIIYPLITKLYFSVHNFLKDPTQLTLKTYQFHYFFSGLLKRDFETNYQRNIRAFFIQKIRTHLDKFPLQDLINICIDLTEMDQIDFTLVEKQKVALILKQLQSQFAQLEKGQIIKLASVKANKTNSASMFTLYLNLTKALLDQIQQNGQTSLSPDFLMDILGKMSDKLNLKNLSSTNKTKFFNFIRKYIEQCNNQQKIDIVNHALTRLIQDSFISIKEKEEVESLLEPLIKVMNTELLYTVGIRGYNIESFFQKYQFDINSQSLENIIKYSILLKKYLTAHPDSSLKSDLTSLVDSIKNHIFTCELFKVFINNMLRIDHSLKLLSNFFRSFPQFYQCLKNPFDAQPLQQSQCVTYLQFLFKLQHSKKTALINFQKKYEPLVTNQLLSLLIKRQYRLNREDIHPNKELTLLILKRFQNIINNQDINLIREIYFLLKRYRTPFINNYVDFYLREAIWKILSLSIQAHKKLQKMNLKLELQRFLIHFVGKKHKHFTYTSNYRIFIKDLLEILPFFNDKPFIQQSILKEGLNLLITQKRHFQSASPEIPKRLRNTNAEKYKTIMDDTYVIPVDRNVDLEALVFNKNSEQYIKQNLQQIKASLQRYSAGDLQNIICSFNLPPSETARQLLQALMEALVSRGVFNQNMNFVDILAKSRKSYSFMMKIYGQFFDKVIDYYSNYSKKFQQLDNYAIINLIKFVSTQEKFKLKTEKIFYELVDQWLQSATIHTKLLVLKILIEIDYPFKTGQISIVKRYIGFNIKMEVNFFLYLQDLIQIEERQQWVTSLAQALKKQLQKTNQQFIPDLHYKYLKIKYPEQMKDVNLDNKCPAFRYAFQPNNNIMTALKQIENALKIPIKPIPQLKPNQAFSFNKSLIIFTSPLRTSNSYEKKFIKKALRTIYSINVPIFDFTNSVFDQAPAIRLMLNQGLFLSKSQIEQLLKKSQFFRNVIKNKKQTTSQQKIEEEPSPIPQESVEQK